MDINLINVSFIRAKKQPDLTIKLENEFKNIEQSNLKAFATFYFKNEVLVVICEKGLKVRVYLFALKNIFSDSHLLWI